MGKEDLKPVTDSWLELFNYGTLPFYWGRYEPSEGNTSQEQLMKTARFLKEKNVKVKGHPLCWHTACADWLMQYDNETILRKQLERIDREVTGPDGGVDIDAFKGDYVVSVDGRSCEISLNDTQALTVKI